jgi:hypothetical protein
MQWLLFVVSIIVAYIGISIFSQLSGASQTALSAFLSPVRPWPFLAMLVGNMFFGLGLYYGFGLTRFAIPAAIAMGVVTSFVYSVAILGAKVTLVKLAGAAIVILGVAMLAF